MASTSITVCPIPRGPAGVTVENHGFAAGYHFEMTIECTQATDEGGGLTSWDYSITSVKASDTLFDCADGCTPTNESALLYQRWHGGLTITFPNGAYNSAFNIDGVQVSPDGKTMTLITSSGFGGSVGSIGTIINGNTVETVEAEKNCQQYGGTEPSQNGQPAPCALETVDPGNSTLDKVS